MGFCPANAQFSNLCRRSMNSNRRLKDMSHEMGRKMTFLTLGQKMSNGIARSADLCRALQQSWLSRRLSKGSHQGHTP